MNEQPSPEDPARMVPPRPPPAASPRAGWSDRTKWWMDLLKTAVGVVAGAVLTLLIVNKVEYERDEYTTTNRERLASMRTTTESFRTASLHYLEGAKRAYWQTYPSLRKCEEHKLTCDKEYNQSELMIAFDGAAKEDFILSVDEIQALLKPSASATAILDAGNKLRDHVDELFDIACKDGACSLNSATLSLALHRRQFTEASNDLLNMRRTLLAELDQAIKVQEQLLPARHSIWCLLFGIRC